MWVAPNVQTDCIYTTNFIQLPLHISHDKSLKTKSQIQYKWSHHTCYSNAHILISQTQHQKCILLFKNLFIVNTPPPPPPPPKTHTHTTPNLETQRHWDVCKQVKTSSSARLYMKFYATTAPKAAWAVWSWFPRLHRAEQACLSWLIMCSAVSKTDPPQAPGLIQQELNCFLLHKRPWCKSTSQLFWLASPKRY